MEKAWNAEIVNDKGFKKDLPPKLSIPQQVDNMKEKGIKFEIMSEADARRFLWDNNYYFKLKAYCKNYYKDANGRYQDLDFAYLVDLSTIDMHLRKIIIKMSLDIEHFLKVKLLQDFLLDGSEDGYEIVREFFDAHSNIRDEIIEKGESSYCAEMINGYRDKFAIWNVVEVMSFGHFVLLYEWFYAKHSHFKDNMVGLLFPVKSLRNAAAHNNCLINNMMPGHKTIEPNKKVVRFVSTVPQISAGMRDKKMTNPVIHDFVALLYVFDKIVTSPKTKEKTYQELAELFNSRLTKHKDYYTNNAILASSYIFVKKIVDFLTSGAYNTPVEQK